MFFKILILLIIAYYLMKWFVRKKIFTATATRFNGAVDTDTLISCDQCGTFFHANQGIKKFGKDYCSDSCLNQKN